MDAHFRIGVAAFADFDQLLIGFRIGARTEGGKARPQKILHQLQPRRDQADHGSRLAEYGLNG